MPKGLVPLLIVIALSWAFFLGVFGYQQNCRDCAVEYANQTRAWRECSFQKMNRDGNYQLLCVWQDGLVRPVDVQRDNCGLAGLLRKGIR